MKKTITKEVTICDYCEEELIGNNHKVYIPGEDGGRDDREYDLHAECQKRAVAECIDGRQACKNTA